MSAQDNKREKQQKKLLGIDIDQPRDSKFDAIWTTKDGTEYKIELKTRIVGKSSSTKRRFTDSTVQEWSDTVLVVSEYNRKNSSCIDGDTYVLFPYHIQAWLDKQLHKLLSGTRVVPGINEVKNLISKFNIPEDDPVLRKMIRQSIFLNNPTIPKKVIVSGIKINNSDDFKNAMEKYHAKNLTNGGPNGKSTKND